MFMMEGQDIGFEVAKKPAFDKLPDDIKAKYLLQDTDMMNIRESLARIITKIEGLDENYGQ